MKAKKSEISKLCLGFSYIFLGFPIEISCISLGYVRCRWNFQPTDRFLPSKLSCSGCSRVPRDLGDAARHPEVSTGCLEVFTGQVEPETRSQWLKIAGVKVRNGCRWFFRTEKFFRNGCRWFFRRIRVLWSSFAKSSFADLGLIFVGFGSIC